MKFKKVAKINIFFLLLIFISQSLFSQVPKNVTVPLLTNFNTWEHHWNIKMEGHDIYKDVNIYIFDSELIPNFNFIRVVFTPINQYSRGMNYINNQNVAAEWTGGYYSEIIYSFSGKENSPWDLSAVFEDIDKNMIEISVQFEKDARLTEGGLQELIQFEPSEFLSLIYPEKKAYSKKFSIKFNGKEYAAKNKDDESCFYSNKVKHVGYQALLNIAFGFRENAFKNTKNVTFSKTPYENGFVYKSTSGRFENYIQFFVDSSNQITKYHHKNLKDDFYIYFDPPVPTIDFVKDTKIKYTASINGHQNLLTGQLNMYKRSGIINIDWENETPEWAKKFKVKTSIGLSPEGNYQFTTEPIR